MTHARDRRHAHVVNIDEVEAREGPTAGTKFAAKIKMLGAATGGKQLGCNWFEVPPGRSAFPRHFHCAIDEAVFVLEGRGNLQIGDQHIEIRGGDYLNFQAGPDHAHRIENTGTTPLRYLCLSSKAVADVVGYPDSKKIGAMASPSSSFMDPPWVRVFCKDDGGIGYFEGEDVE